MVIVDSSVWIEVLRGAGGRGRLESALAGEDLGDDPCLTRFSQLELLMGAVREDQWRRLERYLDGQRYVEADRDTWRRAARTYFDLRRAGKTVRGAVDCCIAEIAIAHEALLLHRDRDFSVIATVRPLRERWFDLA